MKKSSLSDIEIARKSQMRPITDIAAQLGLPEDGIEQYGRYKAKVAPECVQQQNGAGKLVLVSAMSPTPAGEGKTTTTIGLGDALNRIGKRTIICLREPSMGPCFGLKGGAAGGGMSQVVPMEDINLHFTDDLHAIGVAHNLLAALLDNHIHQGNALNIDPRRIVWGRVLDMNDRALRNCILGLGGTANSVPRESFFDITVASEVMAVFCLSESLAELKQRLGEMIVGYTYDNRPVTANDLQAAGAMTVLLKQAFSPNLVQTLENNPAIIHGGPFANIAHGCNSLIATRMAMRLAEYTVTEAGFGADLGAEKFLNIKCRKAGINPDLVVLVATVRALKYHGGMELNDLKLPDTAALEKGLENLKKHIENIRRFGLPVIVAINRFSQDGDEEVAFIREHCAYLGVDVIEADHWARGGAGAEELAKAVVATIEQKHPSFQLLYPDTCSLWQKTEIVAREIYGAVDILADKKLRDKFRKLEEQGYGHLPICIAKTQYSFSSDPRLRGRPKNFDLPLRDIRLAAGAGFVVVLTGDIMTMPGLPKVPSAESIDVDDNGEVSGLF